ncbi:hypothetical protein LTR17_018267 [Elasticomyces elasticus]|nr:hypothetical protein LTR17_018267 [Elasticomyces elasticus]
MADIRVDGALEIARVPLRRHLVWEALQAAGAAIDYSDGKFLPEGNKPLAGVGDRVIALYVTEIARLEGITIGQTNGRLSTVARNERLTTLCDSTGLTCFINLSPGDISVGTRTKSATLEAIVGAAYVHDGMNCAIQVMQNLGII